MIDQPEVLRNEPQDALIQQIALRTRVEGASIIMFRDFTEAMTDLLERSGNAAGSLLVAGHGTPDLAIAADRAGMNLIELMGDSPFRGDMDKVCDAIVDGSETVYISNPNRITGADFALSQLNQLAQKLPHGTLIIDEYCFDFYGITGLSLLDAQSNVIILRSFGAGYGIGSHSGFAVARPYLIRHLRASNRWQKMSATLRKLVMTTLSNDAVRGKILSGIHDESLRIATALTRLGIQNRITPTDFILIRVADPKSVGNFLAANKTAVENLDGYPGLKNYLRYSIQSRLSNDRFLKAFSKMPAEFYRMKTIDRSVVTLRKRHLDGSLPRPPANRLAGVAEKNGAVLTTAESSPMEKE